MKLRHISTLLLAVFVLVLSAKVSYAREPINLYFFWGQGCPHCAKEREFLNTLVEADPSVKLHDFEVWNNQANRIKLEYAARKLDVVVNGVPFLVVGDEYLVGYMNDETSGKVILSLIDKARNTDCPDIFLDTAKDEPVKNENCIESTETINTPIFPKIGNLELNALSLPTLTIAMGFLDGFNPCAMWTLLFLISLLIGMGNKKKMWTLGIAFIVASAAVYFLFMVAWLKLFLFIGFIFWVRMLIALIALAGGFISLKKFLSKDATGCDVAGDEKRKTVFDKLGKVTANRSFLLALLGIIALAFAVNLVELVCSAGLPAVYTQVLSLNMLGTLQYYGYILLYIFFFMIDDLFVFFVAMTTLQITGITTKYVKYSRLIGGALMVLIGLLLLFKPDILMFN